LSTLDKQMNTKACEELIFLHNASNECVRGTPNLSVAFH